MLVHRESPNTVYRAQLGPHLPIVFLMRNHSEGDQISALRAGVDDHISKDESLRFLATRIEALFRRLEVYRSAPQPRTAANQTQTEALVTVPRAQAGALCWRAARIVVAANTITAHIKANHRLEAP